ncbi:hypothetical protein SDRG_02848 [Saprolegnia diclina VS20]|uniref:Uncharacterized protein n=1 Tax=Saprolegnia diclina (strain VS20) TaxID=1156394 RepID=T0R1J1_SAPDV|nr:hypothetical protein SDRG_02848 [Saprolegnia diclina VS20]EQC40200.1 hypothetical protein SDRG_02848 [Saprolegnia diclina VS20]|eukprot:XP_008606674.1 hypothetical protein SDRG_02848 [Saprolegnia diclina VS20]
MDTSMAASSLECQYSYKPCSNPRTTKRNGSLHLLCEFHRQKANRIQQVYTNKKRAQRHHAANKTTQQLSLKDEPALPLSPVELAAHWASTDLFSSLWSDESFSPCWNAGSPIMTHEEVAILNELF